MTCKVCGSGALYLIHQDVDGPWHRCLDCGSDSSTRRYAEVCGGYNLDSLNHNLRVAGSRAALAESMRANIEWFDEFDAPFRSFLDIGCAEGVGMECMAERGWTAYGFDVIPEAKRSDRVVIAPGFQAELFPMRFGAAMTREVIEHVEEWQELLRQTWLALLPGGLFQLQTPRPTAEYTPIVYQRLHLQVFSPMALRYHLEMTGFEIVGERRWRLGQCYLCRRPPHGA